MSAPTTDQDDGECGTGHLPAAPTEAQDIDLATFRSERKPGGRFLDAAEWVDAQFESAEVQARLTNPDSRSPFLDAAEYVEQLFYQEFPNPYPGESDEQFKRRRKKARAKRRPEMQPRAKETEAEFSARMKLLREVSRHSTDGYVQSA